MIRISFNKKKCRVYIKLDKKSFYLWFSLIIFLGKDIVLEMQLLTELFLRNTWF